MSRKSLVPIELPADPTQPLEAATKQYADTKAASDHTHSGLAPALNIKDEGTLVTGTPTGMNFVGGGVTVAGSPEPTITVPGVPIGCIMMWPGTAAPSGWALCDGAIKDTTADAALYAILGTAYNIGGETAAQFRLPNFNGKVPRGNTRVATGGADSVTMPDHQHVTSGLVIGEVDLNRQNTTNVSSGSAGRLVGAADGRHSHGISGLTGVVSGANPPISNIPAHVGLLFIIKVA